MSRTIHLDKSFRPLYVVCSDKKSTEPFQLFLGVSYGGPLVTAVACPVYCSTKCGHNDPSASGEWAMGFFDRFFCSPGKRAFAKKVVKAMRNAGATGRLSKTRPESSLA